MMMMDGGDAGGLLIATQKIIIVSVIFLPVACCLPGVIFILKFPIVTRSSKRRV